MTRHAVEKPFRLFSCVRDRETNVAGELLSLGARVARVRLPDGKTALIPRERLVRHNGRPMERRRRCGKCRRLKPFAEFNGETGYCKVCQAAYQVEYQIIAEEERERRRTFIAGVLRRQAAAWRDVLTEGWLPAMEDCEQAAAEAMVRELIRDAEKGLAVLQNDGDGK